MHVAHTDMCTLYHMDFNIPYTSIVYNGTVSSGFSAAFAAGICSRNIRVNLLFRLQKLSKTYFFCCSCRDIVPGCKELLRFALRLGKDDITQFFVICVTHARGQS